MPTTEGPLISVIMPCYNAARFVGDAIESILSQDYSNLQIIVINDGSTDDSEDVIRQFGDKVEYVRQENLGISAARNSGLDRVRGSFIAFLDSDDIWAEGSLRARISQLKNMPEVDYVFGKVRAFRDEGELDGLGREFHLPKVAEGRLAGCLLIRVDSFFKVGMFDTTLRVGETMDWILRAQETGLQGRGVTDMVLLRRVHANNTVTQEVELKSQYLHALKASIQRRKRSGA